jgi:heat shock protein HslJ
VDGSIVAEDRVDVSLGSTPAVKTYIQIDDPVAGQTLEIANPVTIRGKGAGLPEGNVVVQALDRDGNELALLPTILQGPDVGTGGQGTWEVQLTIETEPGMAGQIRAFSPSPDSDELVADSAVQVTYGEEVLDLEGQTWILERTLLKTEITAIFQDGKLTGSAGCNTYNGTYTITSGSGESQITVGPLATTRMACSQKVMDQESRYLSALEAAEAYMIEGTTLTIYFPGGALIYEAEKE